MGTKEPKSVGLFIAAVIAGIITFLTMLGYDLPVSISVNGGIEAGDVAHDN